MSSRVFKIALTVTVLLIGAAGTAYMMSNRITPERAQVQERAVPVEIMEVVHTDVQVVVTANGTVTAAQQVQLRPEVSGRIIELSRNLVPGGLFRHGELIARIDERDYQVRVTAQQEAVAGARLLLRQERARQAVAEQEWQLMEESIPANQENRDLALRIPQIEQAEAALAAAEGALAKAELDRERCTITAPFDAVVLRESVDPGQLVSPQTEIATLVGTDHYWIQVSLPVEDLAWISVPAAGGGRGSRARVVHRAGAVEISREGSVQRLLGDVDPAGRLARLLVVVDDPLDLRGGSGGEAELPLLLGSYVTVEISGHSVEGVVPVPRRALREIDGGATGTCEGLWIMDQDDRLATRAAEVVWRSEGSVLLRNGFNDGERIVTSTIATPIEGMRLELAPSSEAKELELTAPDTTASEVTTNGAAPSKVAAPRTVAAG